MLLRPEHFAPENRLSLQGDETFSFLTVFRICRLGGAGSWRGLARRAGLCFAWLSQALYCESVSIGVFIWYFCNNFPIHWKKEARARPTKNRQNVGSRGRMKTLAGFQFVHSLGLFIQIVLRHKKKKNQTKASNMLRLFLLFYKKIGFCIHLSPFL